jgi:hypothetical protein
MCSQLPAASLFWARCFIDNIAEAAVAWAGKNGNAAALKNLSGSQPTAKYPIL